MIGILRAYMIIEQEYHWRGLYEIPTYRGKIKRIIAQFSPHAWIEFQWNPLSSFERWIAILCIIGTFLITGKHCFIGG